MKSRILNDYLIKHHMEQEKFARAAVKKKHCKGAENTEIKK